MEELDLVVMAGLEEEWTGSTEGTQEEMEDQGRSEEQIGEFFKVYGEDIEWVKKNWAELVRKGLEEKRSK